MRILVDGEVSVYYHQLYVESDRDRLAPGLEETFAGQAAGLCGGAQAGALWLTTGLHSGKVGFTVELHQDRPPVDEAWEEIVERSPAGQGRWGVAAARGSCRWLTWRHRCRSPPSVACCCCSLRSPANYREGRPG